MKKINLKWDADGIIDSYSVYRSETRINSNSLPVPLVTGLKIDGDLVATLTYDSLLNTGILSANRG